MDSPPWASLLPAHRADGDDQPAGRARCVEHLRLTESLAVAVYADEHDRTYPVPLVVTPAGVRRARPGDGASEALVALLAEGNRFVGAVEVTSWHHVPVTGESAITVDQTNESVVVGDQAVVKWSFVADEGPHPGPALLAELTGNGFHGMPRPWGAIEWRTAKGATPRLLALVVEYLPGSVDGWSWLVDDLREAAASDAPTAAHCAGTAVGSLVADLHRALAGTSRRSTTAETASLKDSGLSELAHALAVTSGPAHELLASRADEIRRIWERLPLEATPLMRVHGDLHIGQVLRTQSSTYALTDFDGNPVVPAAFRAAQQPAASDVAGMAQSFTHAGLVVRKHHRDLDPGRVTRMAAAARSAFLDAYRDGLGDRIALFDERLLRPLALRQVCREFIYAATHLPRWSYVPEGALPMLLETTQ